VSSEAARDDPPKELRLDLPAAHSSVRMARQLLYSFGKELLEPDELDVLGLVTTELLGNAVDHGGGEAALSEEELQEDVRMQLVCTITPARWVVEVTDRGGGDPVEIQAMLDSEALPDLDDERGRGIFLLATMVDDIRVEHGEDGRGLRITAARRHGGG